MSSNKVDLQRLKATPIMEVAERLGMDLVAAGANQFAMRDSDGGISSLQIDVTNNRWKRFSGIEQGGVCGGSVIDLVIHMQDSNFSDALQWMASSFPDRT